MASRSDNWPATGLVNVDVSEEDQTFSPPLRGVSIGTAGNLKVDTPDDEGIVIPGNCLAVGIQHAIVIKKIYSVGTAATQILGLR